MTAPHPDELTALGVLQELTGILLGSGRQFVNDGNASIVEDDPEWIDLECTRRHVALLWGNLQRAVTNEIGSGLSRELDDWDDTADDLWAPRIVVAQSDEFIDYEEGSPWGWRPLADAHRREAHWDHAPQPKSGTWLGWWEPERSGPGRWVSGTLTGFVIIGEDGDLRFAHVVKRRRRTGIARRLVEHAVAHHGLQRARGPFTEDGAAFATSVGLHRGG